jgi:hypothetical protein
MDSTMRTPSSVKLRAAVALALVVAAGLSASCDSSPKVVPGTYRVRANPPTSIGGKTTLRLVQVQDSRCPANVQCIWEGELTARVVWSSGGSDKVLDLRWSVHAPATAVPGTAYSVALDDAVGTDTPVPVAVVRVV